MTDQITGYQKVVGLTGSIGSGKSTVLSMFRELGAYVVSADELAREAVGPGERALESIRERFGADLILSSGELDRKALARLIFSDPTKRRELESILHPRIRELALERFNTAPPGAFILYDSPLLFEAGLHRYGFKKIIAVTAPESRAIERIMNRDRLSREEAEARLRAQMPQAEKVRLADIVIENSGSVEELREKVALVYYELTPNPALRAGERPLRR